MTVADHEITIDPPSPTAMYIYGSRFLRLGTSSTFYRAGSLEPPMREEILAIPLRNSLSTISSTVKFRAAPSLGLLSADGFPFPSKPTALYSTTSEYCQLAWTIASRKLSTFS